MNIFSKGLIITGILLIIIGLLFHYMPSLFKFGKLPGDIVVKKETFSFYFPITSSLIISAGLSLLLYIVHLFKK